MMAEAARVKTIFLVFILSYISRAVLYVIQAIFIDEPLNVILIFYVFYNIWDVVPLTLIMHYHHTCYEAQQATQDERDPSGTIVSVASTLNFSELRSPSSRPTVTTETTLKDSVYEQRMSEIEAKETKGAIRSTDVPKKTVWEDSQVFEQFDLSNQGANQTTSEQSDRDTDPSKNSILNNSFGSLNEQEMPQTYEDPFLQK